MSGISAAARPLILGHRGASALAPENTLAAFRQAIDDGADGIEFDLQLSRDNVPVVIHDANLKRTALVNRMVRDLNAAELRQVNVASWFGVQKYATETIPTFQQVIELFQTNEHFLYPELKCEPNDAKKLAAEVVATIQESKIASRIVVESFDLAAIAEVKRLDAGIQTAALFEPKLSKPMSSVSKSRIVKAALDHGADEIALHHSLASPRVIEHVRTNGLEVVVWTVDQISWVERARACGVKALIANNPGAMVKHRNELVLDVKTGSR